MNKEKQIEEMAKDVWRASCAGQGMECMKCEYGDTKTRDYACIDFVIAKNLYNTGYRKQSEGEWIEASNKPHAACGKKCSLCGARISYREYGHGNHKYCHKCGAKMKGGE